MFWTELTRQLNLFSQAEYVGSSCISRLIAFAEKHFSEEDSEFYRRFAFLTHTASQDFLSPMIMSRFGTLDAGKEPTLLWLQAVGSFETLARSTRSSDGISMPAGESLRRTPRWYCDYLTTKRFRGAKIQAMRMADEQMGGITCAFNSRHSFQVMHHRDYGRLGQDDEFRYLTPYCHDCHRRMRVYGPAVPAAAPEGVKRWLVL